MKLSVRTAIAAIILGGTALGGTAMASTYNDGTTGPGYGDAFLSIADGNNSYQEYLGFNWLQGSTGAIPASGYTTINLGVILPSSATWQVTANRDAGIGTAIVTTALASQVTGNGNALEGGINNAAIGAGNINTAAGYMQQFIQNGYNPNCSTSTCTANNAQANYWGDVSLGGTGVDFSGSLSTVLNVYSLVSNGAQTAFTETLLGTMKLTEVGSTTSYNLSYTPAAVPLPAAVWLLGSGLAGLGVIGRRRKTITA